MFRQRPEIVVGDCNRWSTGADAVHPYQFHRQLRQGAARRSCENQSARIARTQEGLQLQSVSAILRSSLALNFRATIVSSPTVTFRRLSLLNHLWACEMLAAVVASDAIWFGLRHGGCAAAGRRRVKGALRTHEPHPSKPELAQRHNVVKPSSISSYAKLVAGCTRKLN
jgi:hypothetical protein